MKLEQDNIERLMRLAVEYGRSIGFKGDFYIEPKPREPMKHQYDFDAKCRRPSYAEEDIFEGYILGMDTFALGLLNAATIIEDGRLYKFIEERYASYKIGIGKKIVANEVTLTELSDYAESLGTSIFPR